MANTLKDVKQELIYVRDKLYDSLSTAEENGKQKGKKEERDEFWEIFQDGKALITNGYLYAFSYFGWNDEIYNPIKDIISSNCASMYFFARDLTDTKVPIIANNANCNNMFALSGIKRIPYVEFNNCQSFKNTFNMTPLEYIRVGGWIDKSIDFSACPLDVESAVSVIEHLADLSSNKGSATIAFSKHTADLLDENNTQIIPPNEPYAMYNWRDYITNVIYWGLSI